MLSKTDQNGLNHFKRLLKDRFGSEVVETRLFGSQARGDASPESDIDVLVITGHDDWKLKDKIGRIATEVLVEDGVYLSLKVLGKIAYQRLIELQSPFITNVLRDGIPL